jgi:UDP-glucuronate 4-epimerase
MKCLITGAAGFVGMHVSLSVLNKKFKVLGLDNLNSYYDKKLKLNRIKKLKNEKNFKFIKADISDFKKLKKIFEKFKPDFVVNLAAQAGVRNSITNPFDYTTSNLVGFANVLECCKLFRIKHLIYASSSSVYGGNEKFPFKENIKIDEPISYYAASKKSNELMAHSYSHLFKLPTTGLRFFTVYGPWGRPDMFLFLLVNSIKRNKIIKIFNKGKMHRDFTYIDDVSVAIAKLIRKIPSSQKENKKLSAPYKIFNIGNNKPTHLKKLISITENICKKKAKKKFIGMQQGDVKYTHANIDLLFNWIKFKPSTNLESGVKKFVQWFDDYYKS